MRERITTTQIAFQARYGDDLDNKVWDFGDNWNKDAMSKPMLNKKFDAVDTTSRGRLPVANMGDTDGAGRGRSASVPRGAASPRRVNASKAASTASPGGNEPITIFLRDQNTSEETYFSLRYKSTLRIVFTVFAERRGLNQDSLKFTYNGQQLTGYETPHSLALDDRARIDVHIEQGR